MYPRAQAKSFVLPPADESLLPAMAKRTASQASEAAVKDFPVTDFQDFDINLFEVKERGLKKDGTPVFVTSYNQQKLTLNLTPGKKWVQVKWRIQAGLYDKEDASTMKVTLAVGEKVAATIRKIEDAVKPVVLQKLKTAFPVLDTVDAASLHMIWHEAIKQDDLFTAKVVLDSKNPAQLTKFMARPFQQAVVEVAGKAQLQPLLNENSGFMGAKARAAVSAESVWIMLDQQQSRPMQAGITWKIQHFMVDLPEQVRWQVPNVFANASWDDDDEEE